MGRCTASIEGYFVGVDVERMRDIGGGGTTRRCYWWIAQGVALVVSVLWLALRKTEHGTEHRTQTSAQ
jgi:hypothetical protein